MLLSLRMKHALVAAACLAAMAVHGYSQSIPASTAIPVMLTRSVAAGDARPGDPVLTKTIEDVDLPGGRVLPRSSVLTGRVVESTRFIFDTTPYATQKPSVLSIRFDSMAAPGGTIPVTLSMRALAGPVASHEAETPHYLDETDWSGTRILIGGENFSPLEKTVFSPDGSSIVGYDRRQGIFARLLSAASMNPESDVHCDAVGTEQSVGLFSANACGVYGVNTVFLAQNGSPTAGVHAGMASGIVILESLQRSVRLYAGTTALLEVASTR